MTKGMPALVVIASDMIVMVVQMTNQCAVRSRGQHITRDFL